MPLMAALSGRENKTNTLNLPNTRLAKVLGYTVNGFEGKMKVDAKEMDVLQEILRLYGEYKALHSNVVLQSLVYRDCAPEAITGVFKPKLDNSFSYIHPVIAALFLPKIQMLEEHFLYSNIGYIVKCRTEGEAINTKPDYEVLYDMITDPNDRVCDYDSVMVDLRNRFILQIKLWESVLSLRQGKYYNDKFTDFLVSVNNCRINMFDSPDFAYVKDEGAVLRQLMTAFSMRPTVVSTTPLANMITTNPYAFSSPYETQITTIPMIALRLPLNIQNNSSAFYLKEALEQRQWFMENNNLVPKRQNILFSKDIMVFYVNRRFQSVNVTKLTAPYNFNTLPMTIAGFERLNDRVINFDQMINIRDDAYFLRSVVMIERSAISDKKLITGCTAGVITESNFSEGKFDETYLLYDPQGASIRFGKSDDAMKDTNRPITEISGKPSLANNSGTFYERASRHGTIFIYAKGKGNATNEIII